MEQENVPATDILEGGTKEGSGPHHVPWLAWNLQRYLLWTIYLTRQRCVTFVRAACVNYVKDVLHLH